MVVARLVLLLACRSLGAVQPVVLFLLKLALIGALEVFTWLGHLQIQHGALPFSSEQSPDTGGDCVGHDHWPTNAEPSIRVRIPASNTDRIGAFVTASKLPDAPSTHTSQGSRGRTMNAPEVPSGGRAQSRTPCCLCLEDLRGNRFGASKVSCYRTASGDHIDPLRHLTEDIPTVHEKGPSPLKPGECKKLLFQDLEQELLLCGGGKI